MGVPDDSTEQAEEHPTQLAAIMFTDIVGYSRMMEADEERTIAVLRRHNEIVLPLVEAAGGEVIDAIGDGLFILFTGVRNAVNCASDIQTAVDAHNAEADEPDRFRLRIGVHLGDVWRRGDRVYGNGVNVAARVQPVAKPGGICITEDVWRLVSNKITNPTRSIGYHELKNISRRIEIYEVVTGFEQESASRQNADPESEFDLIKRRLMREREQVGRGRQSGAGDTAGEAMGEAPTLERRIESKVFGLVEHVMDAAIGKWESMPDDKKERALAEVRRELAAHLESEGHEGSDGSAHSDHRSDSHKKDTADIGSSLGTGVVASIGFGLGHFAFGVGWLIWPFLIIGVLPLTIGILKSIKLVAKRAQEKRDRPHTVEQRLLTVASELGGTVTVVQAASRAGLPLDEVQAALDRMTAKGYVGQNVRESGVIEYEFPSLASLPSENDTERR